MFVSDNSVRSVRKYFSDRLNVLFSPSAIRFMFQEALMKRLNLSKSELILSDQLKLSESDLLYFRSVVQRLQGNEPFQYILGSTEFYGLRIQCDSRVLIPRPETEELVDWVVKDHQHSGVHSILDLCTGTGCIALALKSGLSESRVAGTDVSEEALQLARQNAVANQLSVDFFQMDVLREQPPGDQHYDIWVSNPPYIPESDQQDMHANVLEYEPHLALFVSDTDPLLFYRRIAMLAQQHLQLGGTLYVEIHERYGDELVRLFSDLNFQDVELRADLQGRARMVKARKNKISSH